MERPSVNGKPAPLPDSLWAAITAPGEQFQPVNNDEECDVAIVGAGFMGLSAARVLAAAGRKTLVLEAADVGWGASGRNHGLVTAGLKRDPHEVTERLGRDRANRLLQFSGDAPARLFAFIKDNSIQCDAVNKGWIQPAHSRSQLKVIQKRQQAWDELGADTDMLSGEQLATALGTDYYHGGWIDRRGGSLNPLALVRALAHLAVTSGATIHCASPVTAIQETANAVELSVAGKTVRAGHVLVCCNAYNQLPGFSSRYAAVRTAQVATEPLDEKICERILPGGESCSDTQLLLTSFRITPDKRLLMGGASATAGDHHSGLEAHLHRAAKIRFPWADELPWRYGWSGYLALTPDHLPQIHHRGGRTWSAIACNGRGIAMATMTGELLAQLVTGMPAADSPVPITHGGHYPLHQLLRPGVAISVLVNRFRDQLAHRF